ncbi:MAG: serpin family protein [Bradymonadales bacterium]
MQRYYFILCLSLLCSLWFFACQPKAEQPATGNNSIDSAQGAAKDEVKEEVEEKDKDDVAQQAVEEPSAEAHLLDGSIDEWVDANNRFAWQALKTFPAGKNVVFSPYSFERAMGMTITGARGETRAELLNNHGF